MRSYTYRVMLIACLLILVLSGCGQAIGVASYPTYIFTHSEIVLFGYTNGTLLQVNKAGGRTIWQGRLNKGEHHRLNPGSGVYHVVGTHPYATLVGDPTTGGVMGYYALNEQGLGTGQLFYTYQSEGTGSLFGLMDAARNFVIFAYQDNTSVTITETDSKKVVWHGTLNASEAHFEPDLSHIYLTVEATHPISALSYSDQGYYVPAEDGRFTGRKFYTWAGDAGGWTHDLNVIAYQDNTSITVHNAETGEVLWQGTLNVDQMQTLPNVNTLLLSIEASEPVAVSVSPTTSYDSQYAHMIFAQDETGIGIGRRFYYPTLDGARLQIFSYEDNANIEVRDASGAIAYQGILNQGENTAFDSIQTLYTISSTHPIAALMDWGNAAGADFAPPYYVASTVIKPTIILPRWLPFVAVSLPLLLLALWGVRKLTQSRRRRVGNVSHPQERTGPTYVPQRQPRPSPRPSGASIQHGQASTGKPEKRRSEE